MEKNVKITTVIIIVLVIIAGLGVYYGFLLNKNKERLSSSPVVQKEEGAVIQEEPKKEEEQPSQFEQVETVQEKVTGPQELKPMENLPEANAFKAETNPYRDGYKNPFE